MPVPHHLVLEARCPSCHPTNSVKALKALRRQTMQSHIYAPFTRYNLLSNQLSIRFDNRVNVCIHDTTGCIVHTNIQPVVNPIWQPAVSCIQLVVKPVVQPGTTGWTNCGCSFNTVERTVAVRSTRLSNRVVHQLNKQSVCSTRLSSRLWNPFDNRLYGLYEHATGCQTGLTTGWMFVYTIQPVVKLVVQPVVLCKRGITTRYSRLHLPFILNHFLNVISAMWFFYTKWDERLMIKCYTNKHFTFKQQQFYTVSQEKRPTVGLL